MTSTGHGWRLGPVEWISGDEPYRPSLWLTLPHSSIVIFFGWQRPSILWL